MSSIRVAVVGVGNCVSSLIQGISYYGRRPDESVGLTRRRIGPYDIASIEVVAAFDIDERKVGRSLREAIFAPPNCATIFETEIAQGECTVHAGPILDGFPEHMAEYPVEQRFVPAVACARATRDEVIAILRDADPHFLVCYLPVGSIAAVQFYASCALEAGVSFINAMPVFIASDVAWVERFKRRGLLVLGDDIKSQVGATILHRALIRTFGSRGAEVIATHQLNIAGNTDFLNMKDPRRLKLKWESKIASVQSEYPAPLSNLYAGPAEYIPHMKDEKTAHIRVDGRGFGGLPIAVDLKLVVQDSPNSAGVMCDILRIAKIEADRGRCGTLEELCAYGFKHPLRQVPDGLLFDWMDAWLAHIDETTHDRAG